MAFSTDIYGSCDQMFYCLAVWLNTVTEGIFWSLILIAFVIVMLIISYKRNNIQKSVGFSLIMSSLASFFLLALKLIPYWAGSIGVIGGALGLIIILISSERI